MQDEDSRRKYIINTNGMTKEQIAKLGAKILLLAKAIRQHNLNKSEENNKEKVQNSYFNNLNKVKYFNK